VIEESENNIAPVVNVSRIAAICDGGKKRELSSFANQ
jgi:hypothetical protein